MLMFRLFSVTPVIFPLDFGGIGVNEDHVGIIPVADSVFLR